MTLKIHTFQIASPEGATDLTEGLAPMKEEYNNEFLRKVGSFHCGIDIDKALQFILDDVHDKYHFLIAKYNGNYAGYTSGHSTMSGYFDSKATFVKPEFRKKGIGEALKQQQLEYARSIGYKGFMTVIDRVNIEAYEMMKKMGAELEEIGEGEDFTGWRVYIDF